MTDDFLSPLGTEMSGDCYDFSEQLIKGLVHWNPENAGIVVSVSGRGAPYEELNQTHGAMVGACKKRLRSRRFEMPTQQ